MGKDKMIGLSIGEIKNTQGYIRSVSKVRG